MNTTIERLWPITRRFRDPIRPARLGGTWGDRTLIMGIVNATPDSFSSDGVAADDGGDVTAAIERAKEMVEAGADIIDVGGESTRPGADRVAAQHQIRRVEPVISALAGDIGVPISIDTTLAEVATVALAAGATIVNDVSGTTDDPAIVEAAARHGAMLIVMHNQRGRSHTDVIADIKHGLTPAIALADAAGVEHIAIDPGFGFGWSPSQNFEMLRRLTELWDIELPILIGTSRKSSIGMAIGDKPVSQRAWGTAATVAQGICAGADIVRVHDVAEMVDVVRVSDTIVRR